jgi:hypothetical protein
MVYAGAKRVGFGSAKEMWQRADGSEELNSQITPERIGHRCYSVIKGQWG